MKHSALLAVAVCSLLTAGATAQFGDFGKMIPGGDKVEKGLNLANKGKELGEAYSPEGRKKVGQLVALATTNKYQGLDSRDSVQGYVTLVGMTVAAVADPEKKNGKYSFGVLNSDEVAAFSAPGGYVMITRGLLKLAADEAELAGVLGHEIAHVVKDHNMKALQGQRLAGFAEAASDKLAEFNASSDRVILNMTSAKFSRDEESEADKASLNYLNKAGYDPQGYVRLLKKLQDKSGSNLSIFATHPAGKDRVKAAEKNAKSGGATNAERFVKMTAP